MIRTYRFLTVWLFCLTMLTITSVSLAEESSWPQRLSDGMTSAMNDLGVKAGSRNLCILTNAPYVKSGAEAAICCLDSVRGVTGCSEAKKNLLFYHTPVFRPLRVVLFNRKSNEGVVLTLCAEGNRLTDACSPVAASASGDRLEQVRLTLGGDKILETDTYKDVMSKLGPSDAFSITSILNSWAAGSPFEFLKACEFHNHYCPGVTAGYLMVGLIKEKYPLGKGQKYVWIGAPPKCGDDAIQILLDLTPGERTCFIKGLTPQQRKEISIEEPRNNVQGILVIWDNKANQGKGAVFKYNWKKACALAGLKFEDFFPKKGKRDPRFFTSRLKVNRALIPYLDKPSELVSVPKELDVNPQLYVKLISAGSNPYKAAGLTVK
jgi:formylmethanofuran dehydrogenase subunit E-like metal-binding protein